MKEEQKIIGRVMCKIFDKDMNLISETPWTKNLIMNAGKGIMPGLVGNTGGFNPFNYLAVGTSSTAVVNSQTALGAELSTLGLSRTIATVSLVTTTNTNDTLQLQYQWSVTGSTTIQEAGIFNAASTGTMLGRVLTTAQPLVNGSVFLLIYQVQFT